LPAIETLRGNLTTLLVLTGLSFGGSGRFMDD
jgi:hypothetical protein